MSTFNTHTVRHGRPRLASPRPIPGPERPKQILTVPSSNPQYPRACAINHPIPSGYSKHTRGSRTQMIPARRHAVKHRTPSQPQTAKNVDENPEPSLDRKPTSSTKRLHSRLEIRRPGSHVENVSFGRTAKLKECRPRTVTVLNTAVSTAGGRFAPSTQGRSVVNGEIGNGDDNSLYMISSLTTLS